MFNEFLFSLAILEKLPAPPLHYGVFDLFGPLTKFSEFCTILTQFLVKQTEFALALPSLP